ncbi:MAG: hypothetical protein ACTSPO_12405 [Candidatus Heimdallarchaeaceae archaeon]
MNFRSFCLRIRDSHMKYEFILIVLYLLALIAVIIPLFWGFYIVSFISALILCVALILRFVDFMLKRREKHDPETRHVNWKELRVQLTSILSESKILIDTAVELKNGEISSVIFSEEQISDTFFEENIDFIERIREIGINGLLCLLFLLQQQPAIASVRAIHKSL